MILSKGSAPSAPDPYTTAEAQSQFSDDSASYNAALNRVNTSGPTGTTNYSISGYDPSTGAPIYNQNTSLSPAEQGIFNQSTALQGNELNSASGLLNTFNGQAASGAPSIAPIQYSLGSTGGIQNGINTSGVPAIADVSNLEQQGQSTALAGEMAAIQPGLDQSREQLDASLRNGGAHPGDPAYDNAMSALDASQTAQKTQAAGAAITAGTGLQNTNYGESANTNSQLFGEAQGEQQATNAAQSQLFGETGANAQASNAAGSTALSDWAQQLGIPLNELNAILGGAQAQTPGAVAPANASTTAPDLMAAFQNQYAGQLAGYNANVSSANTTESTLGSLAAAAAIALA